MSGPVPIIRMFGVTDSGNSVMCHVHGFTPYFYIPAPQNFSPEHCSKFRSSLNDVVLADMKSNKDNISQAVLAVDVMQKESKISCNTLLKPKRHSLLCHDFMVHA